MRAYEKHLLFIARMCCHRVFFLIFFLSFLWKVYGKGAPFSWGTLNRDATPVGLYDMLDNGQPQSGSAELPAPRLVYPVESLKEPWQVFLFYPASLVNDIYDKLFLVPRGLKPYGALFRTVFNGIVKEIDHGLLEQRGVDPGRDSLVADQFQADPL